MLKFRYQLDSHGSLIIQQSCKCISILACGTLILLGYLLLCPPTLGQSVDALTNTSTSASTRLSIKAVETVSVRLASKVALELEPHSQGSFGVAETELGITTNDPEGFEVFLSATDREAALRGVSDQIDNIGESKAGGEFVGNSWGYSISKDLPTSSSIITQYQ